MSVTKIKARIRAYRHEMGWSKVQLAEEAGLSGESVLRGMDADDWNPTSATLEALDGVIPPRWRPSAKTGAAA